MTSTLCQLVLSYGTRGTMCTMCTNNADLAFKGGARVLNAARGFPLV